MIPFSCLCNQLSQSVFVINCTFFQALSKRELLELKDVVEEKDDRISGLKEQLDYSENIQAIDTTPVDLKIITSSFC